MFASSFSRSWPRRAARLALLVPVMSAVATSSPATTTRYIAFGDSITKGINFDDCACQCREQCGYPRRLQQRLQGEGLDVVVENQGKGAERTPEGLTRIDSVLEAGGDVLLLMEGTNDISRRISPETTLFNLGEMARKAAEAGLDTLHATLIPRWPEATADADNVLNENLARDLRDLAFTNSRQLADPFRVFSDTADLFEIYYGLDYPDDPVGHPNAQGYDLLADVFFNVLMDRDRVPPVLGPVEPPHGAEDVSPLARIRLWLYDFGTGIDPAATRLWVNASEVSFTTTGDPRGMEITHLPPQPLSSPVIVTIQARDLAFPPNEMAQEATQFTVSSTVPELCEADATTLCIDNQPGDRRFKITMSWHTALNGGQSGEAFATPLADIGLEFGGLLSFFPGNPEVLIKVLNGCGFNDRFWILGAATTNLGFDLTIEDTLAGLQGAPPSMYEYKVSNTADEAAAPFFDILAFDTCDYTQ